MKVAITRRLRRLMAPFFVAAILCSSALLAGCGGGGGGGGPTSPPIPVEPPQSRTEQLRYGYFGIDGEQLAETADHVTFVMAPDWGPWDQAGYDLWRTTQIITQLQEAHARGVKEAWVMVGYLVFTKAKGRCYAGECFTVRPDAIPRLTAFRAQLDAVGLIDMVKVLYPADEPELYGLTDAALGTLLPEIRRTWGGTVKLGVIYGGDGHGYPGIADFDLIGKDHYGVGAGVLDEMPPIQGGQQWLLVPGGASCLADRPDDPGPFYDFAKAHSSVYAIVPFVWFDRTDERGRFCTGVRSNGMAPKYVAIANLIKGQQ